LGREFIDFSRSYTGAVIIGLGFLGIMKAAEKIYKNVNLRRKQTDLEKEATIDATTINLDFA
jgi:uncharacterized membrane protein YidH (DUF202 family)